MNQPRHTEYDVVIVGARVAGAATAIHLARAGLRVLCVDRAPRDADTLSTHALMRPAVIALHRLGALHRLVQAGTPVVNRTVFDYGNEVVELPVRADEDVPGLIAPRRTLLDPTLVDIAEEAGAEVLHDISLTALSQDQTGRVNGVRLQDRERNEYHVAASWVVGADGRHSSVARFVESKKVHMGTHMAATLYTYVDEMTTDGYRWIFRETTGGGAIPTNDSRSLVFVTMKPEEYRANARVSPRALLLTKLHEVAPDLVEATRERGDRIFRMPGELGYFRQSTGPGWALVGDAGYFKDPYTAHGISDALMHAEILAQGIIAGTDRAVAEYESRRNIMGRPFFALTDRIASFDYTMEELKALHYKISKVMKEETAYMLEPRLGKLRVSISDMNVFDRPTSVSPIHLEELFIGAAE